MEFYKMFANYYNSIFPWAGSKVEFFAWLLTQSRVKNALDLGSATGELTCWLHNQGLFATGVDLSPDLVELAKQECSAPFVLADISDYLEQEPDHQYHLITCIGNTLPHLEPEKIQRLLKQAGKWLAPGGLLVIQTVNYHRILRLHPPGLPLIKVPEEKVTFTRQYDYPTEDLVQFTAILETPQGKDQQSVMLHPVTAADVLSMLPPKLTPTHQFGSFDKKPFDPEESPAWILVAEKMAHGN